jgi:hypothetical protein
MSCDAEKEYAAAYAFVCTLTTQLFLIYINICYTFVTSCYIMLHPFTQ